MNKLRKSSIFHQLVGQCPLCNKAINGHSIALLSSVILNSDNQVKASLAEELALAHQWSELIAMQEGRQDADMKQYYIFSCPLISNNMALLVFIFS